MPGSYLLDTNIAIAFLNGERQVTERIASADAAFLSVISFGGARNHLRHQSTSRLMLRKIQPSRRRERR